MATSLHGFCKTHDLPKSSVYRRCQDLGIETSNGLTDEDCKTLLHEFGKASKDSIPVASFTHVDVGNHQIVLATPDLPQEYSLEGLRTTESVTLEDPLAIAQQFIQIADRLMDAMDSDIQQRETKLKQTQKAKETIATKAGELKLEQRLYRERTRQLDTTLTDETASLQDALKTLQALGKSNAGAA